MSMSFSDGDRIHGSQMDAILEGFNQFGVRNGCGVTPTDPLSMDLNVASGTIHHDGNHVSVSAQTVTISTSDTNDRYDLVVVDGNGTASTVDGTPAADSTTTPAAPDLPDNRVLLAVVFVEGGATEISSEDINDSRVFDSDQLVYADDSVEIRADGDGDGTGTLDLNINNTTQVQVDNSGVLNFPNGDLDLPQGTGVSPTNEGRVAWDTDDDALKIGDGASTKDIRAIADRTTDDLSEGTSNLYYTDERVDDRVNNLLTAGTGLSSTYDDTGNTLTLDANLGDGLTTDGSDNIDLATPSSLHVETVDPGSQTYSASSRTTLETYDAGSDGVLVPVRWEPADPSDADLNMVLEAEYHDGTTTDLVTEAGGTTQSQEDIFVGVPSADSGKELKILRVIVEETGGADTSEDIGATTTRFFAQSRGTGSVSVT